jgi:hypothetical protein
MRIKAVMLGGLLALGAAGPALACRSADYHLALIHSAPPARPEPGLVVVRVEFESTDPRRLSRAGVPARVRGVIAGEVRGRTVLVRRPHASTCDHPFENGRAGILVGRPSGYEGGRLVLTPVMARQGDGFRLVSGR